MRFGDIKRRIYDRLGEDFDSPARYQPFMVYMLLVEACEQWVASNGGNLKTVTIPLVSSQLEYTLPEHVVQVIEVMDDTNNLPLTPMHWRDMYENASLGARPWRDINDTRPFHYMLRGVDKIRIWPTIVTPGSMTVSVVFSSSDIEDLDAALSSDEEELSVIPREFHENVVDYVVGRCLLLGAQDDLHVSDAQAFISKWISAVGMSQDKQTQFGDHAITQRPYINR